MCSNLLCFPTRNCTSCYMLFSLSNYHTLSYWTINYAIQTSFSTFSQSITGSAPRAKSSFPNLIHKAHNWKHACCQLNQLSQTWDTWTPSQNSLPLNRSHKAHQERNFPCKLNLPDPQSRIRFRPREPTITNLANSSILDFPSIDHTKHTNDKTSLPKLDLQDPQLQVHASCHPNHQLSQTWPATASNYPSIDRTKHTKYETSLSKPNL